MSTPEKSQVLEQTKAEDSLTSQSHPQKIACDLPRYIDKVDIAISYRVSGKIPFREALPIPVTHFFHPCKIEAWPGGGTTIGRKVLCTNGRQLTIGMLGLPRLKGSQKKPKNENSLSETERIALSQLCTPGEQPSGVQLKILKSQTSGILGSIAKNEFPYCPPGETTSDLAVSLSAIESYIEIPHPPNSRNLRKTLETALCELYGGTQFGLQRLKNPQDRDLEDHHDKWRIKVRGESLHLKLYPKGDYYRIEVRRLPKGLRVSSHAGLPNMNSFWLNVDHLRQENERILEKIALHLQSIVPKPTVNVAALKSALKKHFKRVDDSIAIEKLIESWATTGVYDPADHKVHCLSSYQRRKLTKLGFCEQRAKNPDVKTGGRYFYVLHPDWEIRIQQQSSHEGGA